jgi:hypothetical protein
MHKLKELEATRFLLESETACLFLRTLTSYLSATTHIEQGLFIQLHLLW